MTGNILDIGIGGILAIPAQHAKVAIATDSTADTRSVRVQHRNNNAIVVGDEIGDTHNATTTGYTHAYLDAIGRTLVYGHQIVCLAQLIAYHLGRYELIAAQRIQALPFFRVHLLGSLAIQATQLSHLTLQVIVTKRQILIHFRQ